MSLLLDVTTEFVDECFDVDWLKFILKSMLAIVDSRK